MCIVILQLLTFYEAFEDNIEAKVIFLLFVKKMAGIHDRWKPFQMFEHNIAIVV